MFDLKSPGTLLSPSNKSLARISPTQRESGLTFPHIQWSCTYSHTHTEHPDRFAEHLTCLTTVPVNFLSCCFSQQQQSREWIPPEVILIDACFSASVDSSTWMACHGDSLSLSNNCLSTSSAILCLLLNCVGREGDVPSLVPCHSPKTFQAFILCLWKN